MSVVIKERAFWLLRLLVVAKRVLCQFSLQSEMTVTAVIFLRRYHVLIKLAFYALPDIK